MRHEMFVADRCDYCGECLSQCPVLHMSPEDAKDCVKRLAGGEYVREVLDNCTGCMSCDSICTKGANPYGLLLQHYSERYLASGIPGVFRCAMPQRDGPNLWRQVDKWLTGKEKADLARWSRRPSEKEVLFLGCNQRLTPFIADSALFEDLEIFSDPEQCCGEYFLRLGLLDVAREKALSLSARFKELGIERIIAFCPACHNTMENLSPLALDVSYDLEIVNMVDWLMERVESDRIKLTGRVSGTVTVQDPCHASGLPEETLLNTRRLLSLIGLSVKEMETSGSLAECCGLGVSLSRYRLRDVAKTGLRRIRAADKTGAHVTSAWCNGCYMVMNMFRLAYPFAPPVFHLIELLQLACGENPRRQMPSRAMQLLLAATEATARDGIEFGDVWV